MINETHHLRNSNSFYIDNNFKILTPSNPKEKNKSKFPQQIFFNHSNILYDKNDPNKDFYDEFIASIKEDQRQFKLLTPKNHNRHHHHRTKKHKNSNTSSVNSNDATIKSNISIDKELTNIKKITQSCFKNQSSTPMMFKEDNKATLSIINNENIEVISPMRKNGSVNPKNFSSSPAMKFFLQYCGIRNGKKGVGSTVNNNNEEEEGKEKPEVNDGNKEKDNDSPKENVTANILKIGNGGSVRNGGNIRNVGHMKSPNASINSNDQKDLIANALGISNGNCNKTPLNNSNSNINDNAGCFLKLRNYSSIDNSKILQIKNHAKSPFLHERKEEIKEIPERISKIDKVAICHFHNPKEKVKDQEKDKEDKSSKKQERTSKLSKKKRLWLCCFPITYT